MGTPCGLISGTKNLPKTCRKSVPGSRKIGGVRAGQSCGHGRGGKGQGAEARGRVGEVCVGAAGTWEQEGGAGGHLLCTIAVTRQGRAAHTSEDAGGG